MRTGPGGSPTTPSSRTAIAVGRFALHRRVLLVGRNLRRVRHPRRRAAALRRGTARCRVRRGHRNLSRTALATSLARAVRRLFEAGKLPPQQPSQSLAAATRSAVDNTPEGPADQGALRQPRQTKLERQTLRRKPVSHDDTRLYSEL